MNRNKPNRKYLLGCTFLTRSSPTPPAATLPLPLAGKANMVVLETAARNSLLKQETHLVL